MATMSPPTTTTTTHGTWTANTTPAQPSKHISIDITPGTICTIKSASYALIKSVRVQDKEEPLFIRMAKSVKNPQKAGDSSRSNKFRDFQFDPELLRPYNVVSRSEFSSLVLDARTQHLTVSSSGEEVPSAEPPLSVAVPPTEEVLIVGSLKIRTGEYVIPCLSIVAQLEDDQFLKDIVRSWRGKELKIGKVVRINSIGLVVTSNFIDEADPKDWLFLPTSWCQGVSVVSGPEGEGHDVWEERVFAEALATWSLRRQLKVHDDIKVRSMEDLSFRITGVWWHSSDPLGPFNATIQFSGEAEGACELSEVIPVPKRSSVPMIQEQGLPIKQEQDLEIKQEQGLQIKQEKGLGVRQEKGIVPASYADPDAGVLVNALRGRTDYKEFVLRETFEEGAVLAYKGSASEDVKGFVFVPYETLFHFDRVYPDSSLSLVPEAFLPRKSSSRSEEPKPKPSHSSLMYS